MGDIENILDENGPVRASVVARGLQEKFGLSAVAARKRLSRIRPPLFKFPIRMLPKNESFLYTTGQRKTERFWTNLHAALRETNSVYGVALDGLMARGGVVMTDEFVRDGCRRGTPGAFCGWNQQGRMPRSSLAVSAARRVKMSVM